MLNASCVSLSTIVSVAFCVPNTTALAAVTVAVSANATVSFVTPSLSTRKSSFTVTSRFVPTSPGSSVTTTFVAR